MSKAARTMFLPPPPRQFFHFRVPSRWSWWEPQFNDSDSMVGNHIKRVNAFLSGLLCFFPQNPNRAIIWQWPLLGWWGRVRFLVARLFAHCWCPLSDIERIALHASKTIYYLDDNYWMDSINVLDLPRTYKRIRIGRPFFIPPWAINRCLFMLASALNVCVAHRQLITFDSINLFGQIFDARTW